MKKILALSLFLAMGWIWPGLIAAQIGLKGGIGMSDIVFAEEGQIPYLGYEIDYLSHRLPAVSYQLGAYGSWELGPRWVAQAELLYARRGLNYDIDFLYDDITYRLHIHYLQLPLLMHYRGLADKPQYFSFFAGPYVAQRLKATRLRVIDGQETKDDMTNVRGTDLGVLIGLAYHLNRPVGAITIEFRMAYSLIDMMDPLEDGLWDYEGSLIERARNVNVSLTVGYPLFHKIQDQ